MGESSVGVALALAFLSARFCSASLIIFCTSIRRLRFTVNPLCQSLFKLSGLHGAWESAHHKVVEPGV